MNEPITEIVVNSLVATPVDGATWRRARCRDAGSPGTRGYGITRVEVSIDGGKTWSAAASARIFGRFAFRPWSFRLRQRRARCRYHGQGHQRVGQTKPPSLIQNPAGYHHNVIRPTIITVA